MSQRKSKRFYKKRKVILKGEQKFKSKSHNIFSEEINKVILSSNDDKRLQSIDLLNKQNIQKCFYV